MRSPELASTITAFRADMDDYFYSLDELRRIVSVPNRIHRRLAKKRYATLVKRGRSPESARWLAYIRPEEFPPSFLKEVQETQDMDLAGLEYSEAENLPRCYWTMRDEIRAQENELLERGAELVNHLSRHKLDTTELRRLLRHISRNEDDKSVTLWNEVDLDLEGIALRLWPPGPGYDEGKPDEDKPLDDRQKEILVALWQMGAVGKNNAVKRHAAARAADKEQNPDNYNHAVAALVERKLIASKRGNGGGIWLTSEGEAAAKVLQERPIQRCAHQCAPN